MTYWLPLEVLGMSELQELKRVAYLDGLLADVQAWTDRNIPWAQYQTQARFLSAVTLRANGIRHRLTLPLVVATFGGSGTGKSTLVNALVGEEVSQSGKLRPTTTNPIVIAHPETELEPIGLPLAELKEQRVPSPLLHDIVLIDCPDPDTSDDAATGTNLQRLRSLLPHCDVLIYTSTQQKYRSATVIDELVEAARGCHLLFVQTHADRDSDIREDWSANLEGRFDVDEMFFVDSVAALRQRNTGEAPDAEFTRLVETLRIRLSSTERFRIREANLMELLREGLMESVAELDGEAAALSELRESIDREEQKLSSSLTQQLSRELNESRHLWERRVLSQVTEQWGASPFSTMLRLWNGLGSLIASSSLLRVRSSAQLAILGAIEGARRLREQSQEALAEDRLDRLGRFGLDDTRLRESRLVIAGYASAAGFPTALLNTEALDDLRDQAARVEGRFLVDARSRIDQIIQELSRRHTGWFTRWRYEVLFLIYPLFILFRVGRNFFWDSFLVRYFEEMPKPEPLLTTDFYIPAGLFFIVWTLLLILCYTRRLHRGLKSRIDALAESMSDSQLSAGLFPEMDRAASKAADAMGELKRIASRVEGFNPV